MPNYCQPKIGKDVICIVCTGTYYVSPSRLKRMSSKGGCCSYGCKSSLEKKAPRQCLFCEEWNVYGRHIYCGIACYQNSRRRIV